MRVVYGQKRSGSVAKHPGADKKTNGQLARLAICFVLFMVVYVGEGVFPDQLAQTGPKLLQVIRHNINLEQTLYSLGQRLAQTDSVLGGVGEFCAEVFAPQTNEDTVQEALEEQTEKIQENAVPNRTEPAPEDYQVVDIPSDEPVPYKPGEVVEETTPAGDALPNGYDHRQLYLGGGETATPVLGRITSVFGYRDHPTKGRHAIHNGVDIGADRGQEIHAFRDGTVAEVGENSDFGKFLYLAHEHGVRTFYAHCDSVAVQPGQKVKAGECVARVGSTGQSTGPHLHFEVEMNGVRLDPLHYIEHTGA